MKQKMFIFAAFFGLIVLMIGLNTATYVKQIEVADSEMTANRSTFNSGSTGTKALYSLLEESGYKVSRWRKPLKDFYTDPSETPETFVMIGGFRRDIQADDVNTLLDWVYHTGGRLVIIDREPDEDLIISTENHIIEITPSTDPTLFFANPEDVKQMTLGISASRPMTVSTLFHSTNAVQASKFASGISVERTIKGEAPVINQGTGSGSGHPPPPPAASPTVSNDVQMNESAETNHNAGGYYDFYEAGNKNSNSSDDHEDEDFEDNYENIEESGNQDIEKMTEDAPAIITSDEDNEFKFAAPVEHLRTENGGLFVEVPYGSGTVSYVSDPYIVSNGAIKLADNVQFAVDLIGGKDTLIAFDEYHHGYGGGGGNQLISYFTGTPVFAIIFQVLLIVTAFVYSRSRRFARAYPENEQDRLSKLEYTAAMAELQQRTKAYDLAMENIYIDFRRRAALHFGITGSRQLRKDLAEKISERLNKDKYELEVLFSKCEDIGHGEATSKNEFVGLISELRKIENELRLARNTRSRV